MESVTTRICPNPECRQALADWAHACAHCGWMQCECCGKWSEPNEENPSIFCEACWSEHLSAV